jgi:hypothetical protein
MPSNLSSRTFDLNLSGIASLALDGGTGKSKKRRLGRDSTFAETPRRSTLGSPLIPVVVIGNAFSPRTYASRKSEAGDPVAKNRSAIFLMSALRSPDVRNKETVRWQKITYGRKEANSTELTREWGTGTRVIREMAREWS